MDDNILWRLFNFIFIRALCKCNSPSSIFIDDKDEYFRRLMNETGDEFKLCVMTVVKGSRVDVGDNAKWNSEKHR